MNALRPHSSSLESLDFDHCFVWDGIVDLSDFSVIKDLTINVHTLNGNWEETKSFGKLLPPSLQRITFRDPYGEFPFATMYEKVSGGELPHLRTLNCHARCYSPKGFRFPSVYPKDITANNCREAMTFAKAVEDLGVQLSVTEVADPMRMPEYDTCPCKCWYYRHRFKFYGASW